MRQFARITPLVFILILTGQKTVARGKTPGFDGKKAMAYLERQCAFGPRNPGSSGHSKCLTFLVEELKKSSDRVRTQKFRMTDYTDGKTYTGTNVMAFFGPPSAEIVLCAHWDTRGQAEKDPDPKNRDKPIMGANDGASGVAVLLEVARQLHLHPPSRGVAIILFDGEDAGIHGRDPTWCQGSRFFARNMPAGFQPQYGILLDMVGDRDLRLPYEIYSYRYSPALVRRVWEKAAFLGLSAFEMTPGYEMVDDHLELYNVGIPCINIIDFEYPHWHTQADTIDKCSASSLEVVGTLLLHILYE
jgi:hypothetical protein